MYFIYLIKLGVTNDEIDISVDNLIYSTISLIKKFETDISVKIIKRAFKPEGDGIVNL
jgi:RNA 3'-terminal phosphate cyclase